jgi:hypothetical protein
MLAFSAGLLRLGFEQERPFHDDGVPGLQTGNDLHLTTQVAAAADRADLEPGLLAGEEN